MSNYQTLLDSHKAENIISIYGVPTHFEVKLLNIVGLPGNLNIVNIQSAICRSSGLKFIIYRNSDLHETW